MAIGMIGTPGMVKIGWCLLAVGGVLIALVMWREIPSFLRVIKETLCGQALGGDTVQINGTDKTKALKRRHS